MIEKFLKLSEENCDNTEIDVSIPGTTLRSNNYTHVTFRVGGNDSNCCEWSNEVTVAIPPPPPSPPPPDVPDICSLDISGYDIHCNYDAGACGGGHYCNRALFDVYVNDIFAFQSNLNNLSTGSNVYTNGKIPDSMTPIDYRGNGLEYKIEVRAHSTNPNPHLGIAQIIIYDLSGQLVFNSCVPNSQVVYVKAVSECPCENCQVMLTAFGLITTESECAGLGGSWFGSDCGFPLAGCYDEEMKFVADKAFALGYAHLLDEEYPVFGKYFKSELVSFTMYDNQPDSYGKDCSTAEQCSGWWVIGNCSGSPRALGPYDSQIEADEAKGEVQPCNDVVLQGIPGCICCPISPTT